LIELAILASRRSANAGLAPLLRNFSSALLGVCCGIPTFDEIRLLKDLDPLHPRLANLRRFPHHACARRQLSLPQEYQCQRYAKRGASAETIGYVATNTAIHPFRHHRTNNRGNHKRNFNSARVVRYLAT
jgi:hypothetical protein